MKKLFSLIIGLAALTMALPAIAEPWCATPLDQWAEAFTLEGSMDIKPPFGTWEENAGMLVGQGQKGFWSTILAPGEQGANQNVTVRFQIVNGQNRPLALPGGSARFRFWYGENIGGWDFGTVLRYADGLNFYRVQLSAARGQLALWDANGGFLQVVPCPVKLATTHTLEITARGAHLQAALDGQMVMDYWDRTLPPLSGQVGLASYMSTVQVEHFAVTPVPAETAPMPDHKPNFHFETVPSWSPWGARAEDKMVVLWDGHEPITFFMKIFHSDPSLIGTFYQPMVKLRPGWRPAYTAAVGPRLGRYWPTLMGALPEAFTVKSSGDTASAEFTVTSAEYGESSHELLTVRWDPDQQSYRYEYDVKVLFNQDTPVDLKEIEVVDPLTFNNRNPGPEVLHRWQPAAHRWWLVEAPDRNWIRMPMVNFLHIGQEMPWEGGTNLLYPDLGAAPAFEISYGMEKPADWRAQVGMCLWGYDFHTTASGPIRKMAKGEELQYRLVLTGWSPENAKKRFEKTTLLESAAKDTTTYIVFDPAGGPFTTTTLQDPSSTMVWQGNAAFALDDTVKHDGRTTLRMTGPGTLGLDTKWGSGFNQFFHYAVETFTRRWLITGWYKSQGLRGRGLELRVKYAYGPTPEELHYIGGLGDQEWTRFAFVTTVLTTADCSHLTFEMDGTGQVWLDGITVRGLLEDEEPEVTLFPVPTDMVPSTELLFDLPTNGTGNALYDESRNGHSLILKQVTWKDEDDRHFLWLDGNGSGRMELKTALQGGPRPPSVTDEMMKEWGFPHEGYNPIFPLKAFTMEWWMRPEAPATATWMHIFNSRWNPVCRLHVNPTTASLYYQWDIFCGEKIRISKPVVYGKWTHVAVTHGDGKVILYLNGEAAEEVPYDPNGAGFWLNRNWFTFFMQDGATAGFQGGMGPFRLYTKSLTPAEVSERFLNGWPRDTAGL